MNRASTNDFAELLNRICDRLHAPEDIHELNRRLCDDPLARREYRSAMDLHALLAWEGNPNETISLERLRKEVAGDMACLTSSAASVESVITRNILSNDRLPAHSATVPDSSARWPARFSPLAGYSMTIAALSLLLALSVAGLIRYSNPAPPRDLADPRGEEGGNAKQFVARLVGDVECAWIDRSADKAIGSRLRVGQRLELQSGLAAIRMNSGARLMLEGPAVLRMDEQNAVHLESGSLVSQVPPPAKGFRVHTTTAQVIDLGTEFGLRTDGKDFVDVEVFEGEVELQPHPSAERNGSDRESPPSMRLSKGEGARFEASRGTITRDPANRHAFARDWPLEAADWESQPRLSFHDDFSSADLRGYRTFHYVGSGGKATVADGKLRISPDHSNSHGVVLADGRHFLWPGQVFSIDLGPHRGVEKDNPTVFVAFKPRAPKDEEAGVRGWRIRRAVQDGLLRLDLHQKQFFHQAPTPVGNIRLSIVRETNGVDFQFHLLDLDDPEAKPVHLGSHSLASKGDSDAAKRPMYVGVTAYRKGGMNSHEFTFDNLRIEPWGDAEK